MLPIGLDYPVAHHHRAFGLIGHLVLASDEASGMRGARIPV